ncbi:MAG: protein phosphatase 2C domain-containing protein [Muribaculaceae bacterium]|nr:protein phosphatase 2C domain-containing protein [Muribaculaceae bacterium]
MKIDFYGATDVGSVRSNNEDAFLATYVDDESAVLCVAIDGIGGYEGGEVAAEIARNTIMDFLAEVQEGNHALRLRSAVAAANNAIVDRRQAEPRLSSMGCVLTAGLLDLKSGTLTMAHVGDSRLYRYQNGVLTKLSHDHSVVGYMEDQGTITEAEAMAHPQRNMISRSLGEEYHYPDDAHFIESAIFPITGSCKFVFCSDGLSDVLNSKLISAELKEGRSAADCADALIAATLEHGAKDNVTVVILNVETASESSLLSQEPVKTGGVVRPVKAEKRSVAVIRGGFPEEDVSDEDPAAMTDDPALMSRHNSGGHTTGRLVTAVSIALIAGAGIGYILGSGVLRNTDAADEASANKEVMQRLVKERDTLRVQLEKASAAVHELEDRVLRMDEGLPAHSDKAADQSVTSPVEEQQGSTGN